MRPRSFLAAVIALACALGASPASAVIQGTESSEAQAEVCESHHEYREAAIWRQCGLNLLQRVSAPMAREILDWANRYGGPDDRADTATVYRTQVIEKPRAARAALSNDLRLAVDEPRDAARLARIRGLVDDETLRWVVAYPDRFYRYGLYRQITKSSLQLAAAGKPEVAVELEARASEICARQYRGILLPFISQYALRLRRARDLDRAQACELLARHYAHLSVMEATEADWLRAHRSIAARELSHTEALFGSPDPEVRRIAFRREAFLARACTHYDTLRSCPIAERRLALEWFAATHNVNGLLNARRFPDNSLHPNAEMALRFGVWDGDPAVMLGLLDFDALSVALPEDLATTNRLLAPLAGQAVASLPSLTPEGSPSDADPVRQFWHQWWLKSLKPGINCTFFSDSICHKPLSSDIAPTDLKSLQIPAGARSGRWDAIVTSSTDDDVLVFSMNDRGAARVWLDGVPQAVTRDLTAHRQVARLLMTTGAHALRWEFAPAFGEGMKLNVSLLSAISPNGVAAVRFACYPRLQGAQRTQLLAAGMAFPTESDSLLSGVRWPPLAGAILLLGLTYGRRRRCARSIIRPATTH